MKSTALFIAQICLLIASGAAFSVPVVFRTSQSPTSSLSPTVSSVRTGSTELYMSDRQKKKSKKRGVGTIIREETEEEEEEIPESQWRVVLHNDEVHTFQYVVRALTKCIGTLDRKAAFEVCAQTHGIGKATVTKTWKKQAQQFCMGLQRQGLTVSIAPDEDFEGGHTGAGI